MGWPLLAYPLRRQASDEHPNPAPVLGVELLETVFEPAHVVREPRRLERDPAATDCRYASLVPDPGAGCGL
jgi:hypothetical protein